MPIAAVANANTRRSKRKGSVAIVNAQLCLQLDIERQRKKMMLPKLFLPFRSAISYSCVGI